ncbi:MAG: FHA domain-containing protein [Cyanobacteria bacterium]|uniref:FHA domain-containing protein n=1 Tax=Geminocystis sp. TaxID=2664100 RepID=UPI001D76311D|nr:FHA domain-containing protein [Cyanobacteria bacterium CG_2015-16_32_12]NCO78872.1 FHA domain-containing protein [Cyanobacteria bacterium CG_2015-22_32_23]NCQ05113.1 FHA domain-containing protein [Cyanobacteria bacterium CG_2015-09_32_10]NCQ40918.1 FHA domain-containing protein [Cyanobacteria bacterium CG_2015-04_32_10]NCS85794.1 FHA domain-containing protein [Cyanobacteria bacterium CG_2015-02_32_10]
MPHNSAQPHKAHILVVEDDTGRREILLRKSKYSIGRAQQSDIRIHSPFVSRYHATIIRQFDDQGYTYYEILDGDGHKIFSANGILVNGRKVNNQQLKNGDKVIFGPQIFIIYQHCPRDIFPSLPPDDPFDITLIDPAMMGSEWEDN